jgi:hypothetical protein
MRNHLRLSNGQLQRRDYRPKGNPFYQRKPPILIRVALWSVIVGCSVLGALFLALAVVVKG